MEVAAAIRIGAGALAFSWIDVHESFFGDLVGLFLEVSWEIGDGGEEEVFGLLIGVFLLAFGKLDESVVAAEFL